MLLAASRAFVAPSVMPPRPRIAASDAMLGAGMVGQQQHQRCVVSAKRDDMGMMAVARRDVLRMPSSEPMVRLRLSTGVAS